MKVTRRAIATVLTAALMGWSLPVSASTLNHDWRRSVGISLTDVATDDTGFTVVTGQRRGFDYGVFLVAAFDPEGAKLWQDSWKPIRGEPAGTMGEAVAIGPDGHVYVLGFGWHCRFGCESGGWFIRAYGRDGTLRWTRQAGGWKTRPRQSEATGIDSWPGGVVITGYEYDDDVGPTASWLRVYDLEGTLAWKTRVRVAVGTEVRVATEDVAVGRSGAIFVAGHILIGPVEAPGSNDLEPFVAGFDAGGGRRWTRIFRERGDTDDDTATSIDVRRGTLAVAGTLGAPIGGGIDPPHLGWLARMSLAGEVRWMRTWGATRPQSVEDVALAPSGTVTTVGGLARHGYALIARTYDHHGRLVRSQVVDPADGSVVGTGVSIDALGASLVGTSYRSAYLSPGVRGRLWRLTTPEGPS
jgi:hypothetical protein